MSRLSTCEYCGGYLDDLGFARRCYTSGCPNCIDNEEQERYESSLDDEYERWLEREYEMAAEATAEAA